MEVSGQFQALANIFYGQMLSQYSLGRRVGGPWSQFEHTEENISYL